MSTLNPIRRSGGLAALLLVVAVFFSISCVTAAAAEPDAERIRRYVKNLPNQALVGQLFLVGLESDIKNRKDAELDELIRRLGVGGVHLSSATVYPGLYSDKNSYRRDIQGFTSWVQSFNRENGRVPFPVFVSVDHEHPNQGTFLNAKDGWILRPPAPMILSASRDVDLVAKVGKVVGVELANLGVNVLFGPVLDLEVASQGKPNEILGVRSFGGWPPGVYAYASHFLSGLQSAAILPVAKHFPGHGGAPGNSHGCTIPIFDGTKDRIDRHTNPFESSRGELAGVMTAHLSVRPPASGPNWTPLTGFVPWSATWVRDRLRPSTVSTRDGQRTSEQADYGEDLLVFSDDLSNMGAWRTALTTAGISPGQAAIRAIEAGHDVLVYTQRTKKSGNSSRCGQPSGVTERTLMAVHEELVERADDDPQFRTTVVEAVERILRRKLYWAQQHGGTLDTLLDRSWVAPEGPVEAFTNAGSDLHRNADSLFKRVYQQAISRLNVNRAARIRGLNAADPVRFIVPSSQVGNWSELLSITSKPGWSVVPYPHAKSIKARSIELADTLSDSIGPVYAVVNDKESADTIRGLTLYGRLTIDWARKNLVVLLLAHPSVLEHQVIASSTIIAAFYDCALSREAIVAALQSEHEIRNGDGLLVDVGDDANFVRAAGYPAPNPAKGFEALQFFPDALSRDCEARVAEALTGQERAAREQTDAEIRARAFSYWLGRLTTAVSSFRSVKPPSIFSSIWVDSRPHLPLVLAVVSLASGAFLLLLLGSRQDARPPNDAQRLTTAIWQDVKRLPTSGPHAKVILFASLVLLLFGVVILVQMGLIPSPFGGKAVTPTLQSR